MFLRQSTAVTIRIGPFVDKDDGVTELTALTPAVECAKAGAFANRSSGTAVAHDQHGWYAVSLDETDTGTLGRLIVKSDDAATYLPVWAEFQVVPATVYDSLVAGTDKLQVDLREWIGSAPNALQTGRIDAYAGAMAAGVITAAAIATGAIDADALKADAIDAIWDEAAEGTMTARQMLRIFLAALAGKLSGAAGGIVVIRDLADSKDRITATVDGAGNRTAVTLDAT